MRVRFFAAEMTASRAVAAASRASRADSFPRSRNISQKGALYIATQTAIKRRPSACERSRVTAARLCPKAARPSAEPCARASVVDDAKTVARTNVSCFSNTANCARTAGAMSASVVGHLVPVSSRIRAHSAAPRCPRVGKCRYTVRAAIPDRSAMASCEIVDTGSSRSIVIALSRMALRVDSRCRSCADRGCGLVMTVCCHHVSFLSRSADVSNLTRRSWPMIGRRSREGTRLVRLARFG